MNCFHASNSLLPSFFTTSACARSSSSVISCPETRAHSSANRADDATLPPSKTDGAPGPSPDCASIFFCRSGMPASGVLLHYLLARNKGQVEIANRAFLTLRWSENILRGCPLARPVNSFRGVRIITFHWYTLRFRNARRGESRLRDLRRRLSVISHLGTLFVKLTPRQSFIQSPIHTWSLRLPTVSVRRELRRGIWHRGPGLRGGLRRQRRKTWR